MSQRSFRALGVSVEVVDALESAGFLAPFKIQTLVLPDALAGSDVLAKSPTGSGKTLAFGVPIVERLKVAGSSPAALVLVPTRELALQVTDELTAIAQARGLRVAAAYGGSPASSRARTRAIRHGSPPSCRPCTTTWRSSTGSSPSPPTARSTG